MTPVTPTKRILREDGTGNADAVGFLSLLLSVWIRSNMKWIEDSAYYQSFEKRSKLLHPLTRTISFRKMEWPQCVGKAGRRKQT
ncbi:hypothetical protein F2Q68_00002196 [Brassica cretica]|uniref:Uncharacterized protein n=1 Tax=Brassica cretica TaxID=69181 RepID=A0A8S9JDJ6_BRACR|nr:hypothetical protein F2Q68_00002196 [Brassica cretica]